MSGGPTILYYPNGSNPQNLETLFASKNYQVVKVANMLDASKMAHSEHPSCVILEWGPTNAQVLDFVKWMRKEPKLKMTPIVVLSYARNKPEDLVRSIEAGADDYLEQPISPVVFLSKIAALMRRASWEDSVKHPPQIIQIDELTVNITARQVSVDDKTLALTYTEYELLVLLVNRKGEALDRFTILSALSNRSDQVYNQVVDKHVENLRKKLGHHLARRLETIRNVGYRFV